MYVYKKQDMTGAGLQFMIVFSYLVILFVFFF